MIQDGRKGRDRSGRRRPGGDAYGRAKAAGSAGDADGGHLLPYDIGGAIRVARDDGDFPTK